MPSYHQRRPEKTLSDEQEFVEIIQGQKMMTLAMALDNEPYLVTVNYGFEAENRCFYFHCGYVGKKLDFLRANPVVWGQVVEDRGYVDGQCEHAFRSVHFRGRVTFLADEADRRHALHVMIQHLEKDPDSVERRFSKPSSTARANLARVDIVEWTGKVNPAPGKS